jgi:uncharacterized protein YjiS (DUF1127 family)
VFIIHFIRTALARRRAISHLQSMDDRLLRDVGILRQDIVNVVFGRTR